MILRPSFRLSTALLLLASLLGAIAFLGTAQVVHASTITVWTDAANTGLWSNASNWTNGVPDATNVATFDDTQGGSDVPAAMDVDTQVNGLNIAHYNGTISLLGGRNLTVGQDGWNQQSGTVSAGASTIIVAGDWSVTGGTFNPGTGTVEFNATTGTQNINSTASFNNLVQSGAAQILLQSALYVTGTLQSSGTLDTNLNPVSASTLQLSSGSLVTTLNDPFTVSGTATLNSENLSISSNTNVPSGEIYTVLTAGTLNGTFSSTNFPGTLSYQNNAVLLTADITGTDLALVNIPTDITTPDTSSSGAAVTYTSPNVTDDSEQRGVANCNPVSGSTFSIGTTTVTCTATDSDDTPGTVSGSFTVTVQGVLTINGTSVNATEGSPANLVIATGSAPSASDSLTANIDWGDGNSSTVSITPVAGGSYTVPASHTYAEEGQKTIQIVVSDTSGHSAKTTSVANVSDAMLTLKQITAGQVKSLKAGLAALYTDADPAGQISDYQATISWGDGTTSAVKIIKNPLGNGFVLAELHSYASKGTYTVTLTIADQGGSQLNKSVTVSIK